MDSQTIINLGISVACAAAGWWLRILWEAQQRLARDLSDLEKELPHSYVLKSDYKEDLQEVKEMLQKIFDKLESKADK
ncbi:MAG: hypothetical protein EB121_03530 [Alphaproteobacteria bacterium]|nr:hypothetical protein [Alphaproteobacteria bacterium]